MTNVNCHQVDKAFEKLRYALLKNSIVVSHLERVKPQQHEIDTLEWRYRLKRFAEGLCAANLLDAETIEPLNDLLFGDQQRKSHRSGKAINYSVDILNEQGNSFVFDVPAVNPMDAYFQLTKRTAYKAIPDIVAVSVYSGFLSERSTDTKPLRIFSQDELVFVSLL